MKSVKKNISVPSRVICLAIGILLVAVAAARASTPAPTLKDVAYGPHERCLLDFWRADSDAPAPVVIFIHGGGFDHGSKSEASGADIEKFLAAGVSFVSISYPYFQDVSLLGIIRDNIARSVQFTRYTAAEWGIDKLRVGVYGGSAGAGSSLWLAFHDDIADPESDDPVLRESSRVTAAAALSTQATYDFVRWGDLFSPDIDRAVMKTWRMMMAPTVMQMYHVENEKDMKTPEVAAMRRELDMLSMINSGDPPVYLRTWASRLNASDLLHHSRHPKAVKEKCDAAGIECMLILDETQKEQQISHVEFLIGKLSGK